MRTKITALTVGVALTGLAADHLARGLRIVSELGLDKAYGFDVKPISAVAA